MSNTLKTDQQRLEQKVMNSIHTFWDHEKSTMVHEITFNNSPKRRQIHVIHIRRLVLGDTDLGIAPISPRIWLNKAFQRHFFWKDGDCSLYVDSIMRGLMLQALEIVEIRQTLLADEEWGFLTPEERTLFTDAFNDGHELMSIDGNNRTKCLEKFYNNEFKWKPAKDFVASNGRSYQFKEGVYFKDLPPELASLFLSFQLVFFVNRGYTTNEIHETFKRYHATGAMNAAEIRNSIQSQICDGIRDKANEIIEEHFAHAQGDTTKRPSQFFKKNHPILKRRQLDELMAKFFYMYCYYGDGYPTGQQEGVVVGNPQRLENFYKDDSKFARKLPGFYNFYDSWKK